MNRTISAILAMLACSAVNAADASPDDACEAVAGWAALQEALAGGERFGTSAITGVKTCSGADGKGVFYVVTFEGGGYAIASGDTETEPILGYSAEGEWIDDEARNPLLAMLRLDVAAIYEAQNGAAKSGLRKRLSAAPAASESAAAQRWAKLRAAAASGQKRLAATVTTVTDGQMFAGDLRVGPLLASKWAQGDVGGAPCYNYCTPLNRIAGCVAIMAAQIMYYHKWPQGAVSFGKKNRLGADRWSYGYGANSGRAQIEIESGTFGSYEVWCNELLNANGERWLNGYQINGYQGTVAQTVETRYTWNLTKWEPAFGGTYDWNNMLDDPQAAASNGMLTDANRLAIGHLVRDVGLTVPIRYELGGGEGSAHATLALSLVDTFQYADAVYKSGVDAEIFRRGILANLDAKLPVGVTIPGHAVVADGYGYVDGVLYVHFNMGWGAGGGWYRPPAIYDDASLGGSNNKYSSINTLIYNIRPEGTEGLSIVSGRVFDAEGNPISGVTVCDDEGAVATTDEKGIYAIFLKAGEHKLSVTSGTTVAQTNLTVAASTSPYIYKDGVTSEGHEDRRSSVGNVWGADLHLAEIDRSKLGWVHETADTTGLTGVWSGEVAYAAESKTATLADENSFTPNTVSASRYVVVTATLSFDEDGYDDVDCADAKAAVRIGTNGCFQVFTRVGGQRKWQDVTGATPVVGATYTVKLVLDTMKKTYTATIVNGAKRPLSRNGEVGFAFANQADGGVESIDIVGESVFTSLFGRCMESLGFSIRLR